MDKYYKWKVLALILVVAISIWKFYPLNEKINLGLDLQGGMQLLLEVELEKIPENARKDATDRAVEIIRNRIDEFGVREPVISKQGKNQVAIQLPGVTDRDRAREIVGKTAHLEFKKVSSDGKLLEEAKKGNVPAEYELKELKEEQRPTENILLEKEPVLTGDHLVNAAVSFDQSTFGQPVVTLEFDKNGAEKFATATEDAVSKFKQTGIPQQLAIVLDGEVRSAPQVRTVIPDGRAQIEGNFSYEEANDLSLVLRAGALPAPVKIIEERTVGPTLGRDSVEKGIKAAFFGTLLTFIFMPLYYGLSGMIANFGLVVYILMILGSLGLTQSSLTLPGIAGFILSIGMAVDANILISERIKEELALGKTARSAISAGYHRAFSAILDSNVAIFITAAILFYAGTGPVKGFAVTLGLGQIASMFSSLTVTRIFFDFISKRNPNLKLSMRNWFGTTNFRFLKGRFFAYGFSILTLVIGIAAFVLRGQENFGVEFTGGTMVQIQFKQAVTPSDLRSALEKQGVSNPSVQNFGEPNEHQFVVRTREGDSKNVEKAAEALVQGKNYEIMRVDLVGPSVSADLKTKALWAVFWSSLGILVYVGFRFQWRFAMAAVVALLHDVLFTFGVYALSGREINLPTVAALLTVMGYSVNDTIVIFDRVRENLRAARKKTFTEIVELSINQMFVRTQFTSLNVLFGALALFIFGGGGISDFAFTLCVGFAIGVYTTLFLAPAVLVDSSGHRR